MRAFNTKGGRVPLDYDGPDLLALSEDAQAYGEKRLGLDKASGGPPYDAATATGMYDG